MPVTNKKRTQSKKKDNQRKRRTMRGGVPSAVGMVIPFISVKFFSKPRNAKTNKFRITNVECVSTTMGKENLSSQKFDIDNLLFTGKITGANNPGALRSPFLGKNPDENNIDDVVQFKLLKGKLYGYYIQLVDVKHNIATRQTIFEGMKTKKIMRNNEEIEVHGSYLPNSNDVFRGSKRDLYNVPKCTSLPTAP